MGKPAAPSMPTKHQIEEVHNAVKALHPTARIKGVGPDGVQFDYPDHASSNDTWHDRPFSADST